VSDDIQAQGLIKPHALYDFFDAVRFRSEKPLTQSQIQFLQANAVSLSARRGNYIRGFDGRVWNTVAPNEQALQFLADLNGVVINYLEIARDLILPGHASIAHDFFNAHFVQPWHGKRHTLSIGATTYTGQRKHGEYHHFAWYADRPCKLTGEVDCFHIEARYQGRRLLSRLGIEHPRDLLTFDHEAFWARHMRFRIIDYERLGRCYLNRKSGSRRYRQRIHNSAGFAYNVDRATGTILYRFYAWSDEPQRYCIQFFIDQYRSNPILMPLRCNDICLQIADVVSNPHEITTSSVSDTECAVNKTRTLLTGHTHC
jgi:hypothetical protein